MRADQHERRIEQALCGNAAEIGRQFCGGGFPVIGVHDELNQGVEFDRVEPRSPAASRTTAIRSSRPAAVEVRSAPTSRGVPVVREADQPDDVSHPAGQLQHPGSVAADQQRHRLRRARRPAHPSSSWTGSASPSKVNGSPPSSARITSTDSTSRDDPRAGRVERDADGVVLGLHVPGPDAELEPTAGHRVERRRPRGPASPGCRRSLLSTRVPVRRRAVAVAAVVAPMNGDTVATT